MASYLEMIFDPSGFVPRAVCGQWTTGEILLNNVSDLLVALAYVSIPVMLLTFARRQRAFPFSWLSVVFAAFILTCGATHVMEIVLFYHPIYRLAGWVKAATAVASWIAVVALYRVLPMVLALHSPTQLQAAKDELTRSHNRLEENLLTQNEILAATNTKLRDTLQELEEANEIKSRFLANLSHELRTPMVSIIGMAELALEDDGWNMRDSLVKIGKSARSLDALLADLLEFSKIEVGRLELRPRPFQLGSMVDNIQSTLSHFAMVQGLSLETKVESPLVERFYYADSSRLQHVLVNLIQNGLKFTDEGGVTLKIESIGNVEEKDLVRFCVSDTGAGIAEDKLLAIFEPFTQVDDSLTKREAGSGLGLAIASELLGLMGASLAVESTLGQGTLFSFELALAITTAPTPATHLLCGNPSKGRILLVEDNPINRTILQKILSNAGHIVTTAENGAQALRLFAEESFDLALLDLQLPDLDGISIATQVRADGIAIPIYALTAHGEDSYRKRATNAGMTGFLVKPTPTDQLLTVIQEALTEAGVENPEI